MWTQLLPAFRMTLALTLLTGLLYPGLVTAACQVLFPSQANGSLLTRGGATIGSALIGQEFARPEYFHSRPSAVAYDASLSGGSNLGPTSQKLLDRVKTSVDSARAAGLPGPLPPDLVTTSASGLDPHISPANAALQLPRVARARAIDPAALARLVEQHSESRDLGFLGEPRVNVLLLNMALDKAYPRDKTAQ